MTIDQIVNGALLVAGTLLLSSKPLSQCPGR